MRFGSGSGSLFVSARSDPVGSVGFGRLGEFVRSVRGSVWVGVREDIRFGA